MDANVKVLLYLLVCPVGFTMHFQLLGMHGLYLPTDKLLCGQI